MAADESDIATLGLRVDGSELVGALAPMDALAAKGDQLEKKFQQISIGDRVMQDAVQMQETVSSAATTSAAAVEQAATDMALASAGTVSASLVSFGEFQNDLNAIRDALETVKEAYRTGGISAAEMSARVQELNRSLEAELDLVGRTKAENAFGSEIKGLQKDFGTLTGGGVRAMSNEAAKAEAATLRTTRAVQRFSFAASQMALSAGGGARGLRSMGTAALSLVAGGGGALIAVIAVVSVVSSVIHALSQKTDQAKQKFDQLISSLELKSALTGTQRLQALRHELDALTKPRTVVVPYAQTLYQDDSPRDAEKYERVLTAMARTMAALNATMREAWVTRQQELAQVQSLNRAHGQTAAEVEQATIRYQANVQVAQDSVRFTEAQAATMNRLTYQIRDARLALVRYNEQMRITGNVNAQILRDQAAESDEWFRERSRAWDNDTHVMELAARKRWDTERRVLADTRAAWNDHLARLKETQQSFEESQLSKALQLGAARMEAEKQHASDFAEINRNAVRQMQDDVKAGFEELLSSGEITFDSLGAAFERTIQGMVASIAAARIGERFQNAFRNHPLAQNRALGAAAGFGIGYGVGAAGGGVVGGAASGAVAGFSVGGPAGAAIGGIAGFIGGLLGSAKASKEAARAAEEYARQMRAVAMSLQDFQAQAFGEDEFSAAVRRITQQGADLMTAVLQAYGLRSDQADTLRAWRAQGHQLNAAQTEMLRQLDAIAFAQQRLIENARQEAQRQKEEAARERQRVIEDYQVRQLRAEGHAVEADALAFALQQQREYAQAVADEADAQTLAALRAAQAAEAQARLAEQTRQATEAEIGLLQRRRDSANASAEAARNLATGLQDYLIGLQAGQSPRAAVSVRSAEFERIAALAQAGDREAAQKLPQVAQSFLDASRAYNASGVAYQRDSQHVQEIIADVASRYEKEATIQEQIRDLLDRQLQMAQDALNALNFADANRTAEAAIAAAQRDYAIAEVTGDNVGMIEAIQALQSATLAPDQVAIDALLAMRDTFDAAGQAQIDQQVLLALQNQQAYQQAAAAQVAAINAGASAAEIQRLAMLTETARAIVVADTASIQQQALTRELVEVTARGWEEYVPPPDPLPFPDIPPMPPWPKTFPDEEAPWKRGQRLAVKDDDAIEAVSALGDRTDASIAVLVAGFTTMKEAQDEMQLQMNQVVRWTRATALK